mgnify:CR=1 FL=1
MTPNELEGFLKRHHLSNVQFAKSLGVTQMAVIHWLTGKRSISLTVGRLCRLFDKRPELLNEFGS